MSYLFLSRKLKTLQLLRPQLISCNRRGMNFRGWLLVIRLEAVFTMIVFRVLFRCP